jgi:8-oxo-dGTP diphosphatase
MREASVIPASLLLLQRTVGEDQEVFLLRRHNTGFQDGNYTFISGHVEEKELPKKAICREAFEEAGITVEEKDLSFERVIYQASQPSRMHIFFSANKWQGDPYNAEPQKCDDARWFSINSLPENLYGLIDVFLRERPQQIKYSEEVIL